MEIDMHGFCVFERERERGPSLSGCDLNHIYRRERSLLND
jgi:hypothetical protein